MGDLIEKRTFRVEPEAAGERLDAFLARQAERTSPAAA